MSPNRETMSQWLDLIRPLIELVARKPWASVLTVALLPPIATAFVFVVNPDPFFAGASRLLDTFGQEQEAAQLEQANDQEIYDLISRVMGEARAGRAVVKIFLFDPSTYQRSVALVETHEVMDPIGERTGIRQATIRQEDVQATLDQMFPGVGRAPRCITRPVGGFPDRQLNQFLAAGGFAFSSACPMRALDGERLGVFALSTRDPSAAAGELELHTRDAANTISGYLSRSAAVEDARNAQENRR